MIVVKRCKSGNIRVCISRVHNPKRARRSAGGIINLTNQGENRTISPMLIAVIVSLAQILGVLTSVSALLTTRTAQGAIAWIVSLNTFPYLAVPAYWIFGRTKFNGYVRSRKEIDRRFRGRMHDIAGDLERWRPQEEDEGGRALALERIARLHFTRGNSVQLLTAGELAFDTMFRAIASAKRYCLIQFYIIRNDVIGKRMKELLKETVRRGVEVYVLFDEIGSYRLFRSSFVHDLRDSGVHIQPFSSTRGARNRFQLNFRNHRKAMVIDGVEGYLGGLNVGDEYLGRSARFGPWRDTHLRIVGPAITGLQLTFIEDWHWATGEYIEVDWNACVGHGKRSVDPEVGIVDHRGLTVPTPTVDDTTALVLPSGPSDDHSTASLLIQHAIHNAVERLWIASPYFVPDEGVQDALKLAVLRGVDVRILIPDKPDHLLVYLSAFAFVGHMIEAGVRIYRYLPGFLHQKVVLVDSSVATVGTVNLDNRSFRLNFEITAIVASSRFAKQVEAMLERDFSHSRQMTLEEIERMPMWLRLVSRFAYLFAPLQ